MTKRAFDKIAAGLNDAIAIAEGRADPASYRVHVKPTVDVAAIRKGLNLTQAEFAARFGFPIGTLRDWEQRRSVPDQPARILLTLIARIPKEVEKALADASAETCETA